MKVIIITLIILALVLLAAGLKTFTVVSGSMEPNIKNGSLIVVKKYPTYKRNDLIAFHSNQAADTITHRIVKIEQTKGGYLIYTKGDNNANFDEGTIKPDDIIGKIIFTLPLIGKFNYFVSSQKILPITFYVPSGIMLGTLLRKLKNII
jgi:signal peptidase I